MAFPERIPQSQEAQYQEPDPASVKPAEDGVVTEGFRMHSIIDGVVHIEPVQENVYRYPPVQVGVPRRPDFIAQYINVEPTVWSEHSFTPADKSGPVKMLELLKPVEKPKDIAAEA